MPREIIPEHPFLPGQNIIVTFKKLAQKNCFGRDTSQLAIHLLCLPNKLRNSGFICQPLCSLSYVFSHTTLVPYILFRYTTLLENYLQNKYYFSHIPIQKLNGAQSFLRS